MKNYFQKEIWHFFLLLEFKSVTFIINKFYAPLLIELSCPEGKEYQPCVRPCEARTCLNRWFYGHSSCLNLREDCVCENGTILHRPYSTQCIPEKECGKQQTNKTLLELGEICWETLIKNSLGIGKEMSLLI